MSIEVRHFVLVLTNYILSGFAAFCFIFALIFDISNAQYVIGVVVVFIFIINIFLILIPVKYQGQMIIRREEGKRTFLLELNENPDGFEQMNEIRLKVVNEDPQDKHVI